VNEVTQTSHQEATGNEEIEKTVRSIKLFDERLKVTGVTTDHTNTQSAEATS